MLVNVDVTVGFEKSCWSPHQRAHVRTCVQPGDEPGSALAGVMWCLQLRGERMGQRLRLNTSRVSIGLLSTGRPMAESRPMGDRYE